MVVEFGFVVSVRSGQVFSKLNDISETSLIVGIVTSSSSGAVTAAAIPVIIINSDCVNDSQARISIYITVTLVLYTDGRTILVTHKTDHICKLLSPYSLLIADFQSPDSVLKFAYHRRVSPQCLACLLIQIVFVRFEVGSPAPLDTQNHSFSTAVVCTTQTFHLAFSTHLLCCAIYKISENEFVCMICHQPLSRIIHAVHMYKILCLLHYMIAKSLNEELLLFIFSLTADKILASISSSSIHSLSADWTLCLIMLEQVISPHLMCIGFMSVASGISSAAPSRNTQLPSCSSCQ